MSHARLQTIKFPKITLQFSSQMKRVKLVTEEDQENFGGVVDWNHQVLWKRFAAENLERFALCHPNIMNQ